MYAFKVAILVQNPRIFHKSVYYIEHTKVWEVPFQMHLK